MVAERLLDGVPPNSLSKSCLPQAGLLIPKRWDPTFRRNSRARQNGDALRLAKRCGEARINHEGGGHGLNSSADHVPPAAVLRSVSPWRAPARSGMNRNGRNLDLGASWKVRDFSVARASRLNLDYPAEYAAQSMVRHTWLAGTCVSNRVMNPMEGNR